MTDPSKPLYQFALYKGDEVEHVALNGRIIDTRIVESITDDGSVRFEWKDGSAVQGIKLAALLREAPLHSSWRLKEKQDA